MYSSAGLRARREGVPGREPTGVWVLELLRLLWALREAISSGLVLWVSG